MNWTFLKDYVVEYCCNVARDITKVEFILNYVIIAGMLTLSGINRDETKWNIFINIYKVNLARFSDKCGCAQRGEIKNDSQVFHLNNKFKNETTVC